MTKTELFREELSALLRARNTLLWITTKEEQRAEAVITDAAGDAGYEPVFWDVATGLSDMLGKPIDATAKDPNALIGRIRQNAKRQVWVLRDYHRWISDAFPASTRGLKSLARALEEQEDPTRLNSVIILSTSSAIPPDLDGVAIPVTFPMPERADMLEALYETLEGLSPDKPSTRKLMEKLKNEAELDKILDAVMGLTVKEASNCWAKSIATKNGDIDVAVLIAEKKRLVQGLGITWVDPNPRGLDAVGGMEETKEWAITRKLAFTKEAREFGLPLPKGLLLVGVPGCGKTMFAKCLATAWGVPLLLVDLGEVKSKWVGESEANLRTLIARAEAIGSCILLFDEIEKMLAGASGESTDGGVAQDALGFILRWMNDKTSPVFVVATANDISKLPPEFLRKGRFDELFFVDLPNLQERVAIVSATLEQYGRDPSMVDPMVIAMATEDFSGAEIAALVPDAMFAAFKEGRDITTEDLLNSARATVPLSKTSKERIQKLREWADSGAARRASRKQTASPKRKGRAIELG